LINGFNLISVGNRGTGEVVRDGYVVATFGLEDTDVVASESTASFLRDFPHGHVYDYPGPHDVSIEASPPRWRTS
jgi:hypothetical protein